MRIQEARERIKAAGMRFRSCWGGQIRVSYPADEMPDRERREATAYYADDWEDAALTAERMREEANRHGEEA